MATQWGLTNESLEEEGPFCKGFEGENALPSYSPVVSGNRLAQTRLSEV